MISSNIKKLIFAISAVVFSLLLTVISVFAYFSLSYEGEDELLYGTFSVEVIYAFTDNIEDAENLSYIDGLLTANITDVNAPNHYTKLRLWIKFKGYGEAYLRAGISVSWYSDYTDPLGEHYDIIFRMPYEKLTVNTALWLDDRKGDDTAIGSGYLYFSYLANNSCSVLDISDLDPLSLPEGMTLDNSGSQPELTIKVLNGLVAPQNFTVFEGMTMKVLTSVSAVQTNRYKQFWGIQNLPVRN